MENTIDKAARMCGNKARLAEHLGMSTGTLTDVCKGRRRFTIEQVAALAALTGESGLRLLAENELGRVADLARRAELRQKLFTVALAGAGLLSMLWPSDVMASRDEILVFTYCTVYTLCALAACVQKLAKVKCSFSWRATDHRGGLAKPHARNAGGSLAVSV